MSDLVGNPEDRFSRVEAHLEFLKLKNIKFDVSSVCNTN